MRLPPIVSWRGGRARIKLIGIMVLIALTAISLRLPGWWVSVGRSLQRWEENRREKALRVAEYRREEALRDAWNGPVTIRVNAHDDLESVLLKLQAAMAGPQMKGGPMIDIDTGGLRKVDRSLRSSIDVDLNAAPMPAREVLGHVLNPLGLACKIQDRRVMITSAESPDELLFFGDHGEVFCDHGVWLSIWPKSSGP